SRAETGCWQAAGTWPARAPAKRSAPGSTSSTARATCRTDASCSTANSSAWAWARRTWRRCCAASTSTAPATCACWWRWATAGPPEEEVIAVRAPRNVRRGGGTAFTVVGVDNLLVQIARCCQPLPGEAIAGYLTRSRGVSVHRADCAAFARLAAREPQRVLPVEWGASGGGHEAAVVLDAVDRKYLLKDVTNLIAQEDAHVLSIDGGASRGAGRVQLRLSLRVADFGQLSRLLGRLEALPGVERARRA